MSETERREEAVDAFIRGDYVFAKALFEKIAAAAPENWLHVLRCREQLKDEPGIAAAAKELRSAAASGHAAAAFAYHLLVRETARPWATAAEIEESRRFLRQAAGAGFAPAVEQLRADLEAGLTDE